ncbi:YbeD family protein [Salinisphaera hydrothermalis]|uniref:UPF0250 protein C41B8_10313 n=1 Tax=Salinisphaera hydrothermalis (strain C41B8) TaxID=1304275 RepID=A0A084IL31_SALHC|nr:DUF493 domain-containing protein [Salinisphaera hydrothermalis]KEZ77415.1 hypothetical protein C41B8_10313 [Salinisphaera hydrothermalis C41B8]
MSDTHDETLLEFPCEFAIKAFGRHGTAFEQTVYTLIKAHAPELTTGDLSSRESSGGRYIAVTASINAKSKAQLDAIYKDLSDHEQVLMSL